MEQQRVGELGAVAVARPDRFGEPAQLAPTPGPALDPLAVVPSRRESVPAPGGAGGRTPGRPSHAPRRGSRPTPRAARRDAGRSSPTAPETSRRRRRASRPSPRTPRRARAARWCRRAGRRPTRPTRRARRAPPRREHAHRRLPARRRRPSTPATPTDRSPSRGDRSPMTSWAVNKRATRRPTIPSPTTMMLNDPPGKLQLPPPPVLGRCAALAAHPQRPATAAAIANAPSTLRRTFTSGSPVGRREPNRARYHRRRSMSSVRPADKRVSGNGARRSIGCRQWPSPDHR